MEDSDDDDDDDFEDDGEDDNGAAYNKMKSKLLKMKAGRVEIVMIRKRMLTMLIMRRTLESMPCMTRHWSKLMNSSK